MTRDITNTGLPGRSSAQVSRARRAVYAAFIANGFIFASWAARIPQVRDGLRVSPGVLGLILDKPRVRPELNRSIPVVAPVPGGAAVAVGWSF